MQHATPSSRVGSRTRRAIVLAVFGTAVVASGLFRFATQEGGEKGLWFGLVVGGLAYLSGWLVATGRTVFGLGLGAASIALVAGWFSYESFVMKGLDAAETRQLLLIVLALLAALLLTAPTGRSREAC